MVDRFFTTEGVDIYAALEWIRTTAKIESYSTGNVVFQQDDIEFPASWSQNAINIVSQKYFNGTPGQENRENSVKQLINRVVNTITQHGQTNGYFNSENESEIFNAELKHILVNQLASFNSPVWFNIGASGRSQQASACFILSVEDTIESILNWYKEEGMIFKGGSGSGVNISSLRSSHESLSSSGGKSSGPVSFMRGADSVAGTIKSGGKTRRAAKMVILNIDHPDVEEFIWCKTIEERKSRVLAAAGFDMDLDGKDAFSVQYQNANNSVRVSDDFMKAVENDADWNLLAVKDGRVVKTVRARDLWQQIAESSWECADPGLQFDTTINHWHTTPNAGRINGSNPCSEYMHLDDSACNLASINLLKFLKDDGTFDIKGYIQTIRVVFTAQEILVGYSEYPTDKIAKNARSYRQLGLGYANLGALLMAMGLPYDSDEGRALAGVITAIMTGEGYAQSSLISSRVGPFEGFHKDKEGMLKVISQHKDALGTIKSNLVASEMYIAAQEAWDKAVNFAAIHGVRNSQATVLAPTGTIAFMMDCDTTGIEPDFSLTKYKKLVGGGNMIIVNQTVPRALKKLGYSDSQSQEIQDYIKENSSSIGAPHLKDEHQAVFSCAVGDNSIHYMGHIKMMAAAQPFLSGAISKTVNMPEAATVEDIEELHLQSWKLGLKAVAIYRDNCKVAQPLSNKKEKTEEEVVSAEVAKVQLMHGGYKELPKKRTSKTFEFRVADCKGFFTVGEFEDGSPAEIFMTVSKQGSTLSGIMDAFAISVSRGLRNGVPLRSYVKSFIGMSFAPGGITDDPEIRTASSLVDYIFRKLSKEYLSLDDQIELGLVDINTLDFDQDQPSLLEKQTEDNSHSHDSLSHGHEEKKSTIFAESAPLCFSCGNITQRAGSCYICTSCGSTSGCS
jgi:ribonucleoside-diphosphate reductase alpha chain